MVFMNLDEIVRRMESQRVLLIGDTILDIYTYGSALGLSAETPTIVARRKEVKYSLGGAALVARNLLELGAAVEFVTLIGKDEEARYVRELAAPKLTMRAIVDPARPTTVKHRFWVDNYKLFQLDQRDDREISAEIEQRVKNAVDEAVGETNLVIISDYRHGLLSESLLNGILPQLRGTGKAVYVDSQVSQNAANHCLYKGGCIMCLNLREARCIDPGFEPVTDPAAFSLLNHILETDKIAIKLGERGALYQNASNVLHAPARDVVPTDTTGAGDAFLSAFCLAGEAEPESALAIANAWAALAIQIHGTVPPNKIDLYELMRKH